MGDSASRARRYALRLLSVRGRSERELRGRLERKGFNTEIVGATISELKGYKYIDDRALANDLLNHSVKIKNLGKRGARAFLFKRGIPEEIIETLDLDSIDEVDGAMRVAERRLSLYRNLPERKTRNRIVGLLQRRGHSGDTIRSVLRNIFDNDR